jgi:DNA helicase II / ATP-dependent DNA helicase PcrA
VVTAAATEGAILSQLDDAQRAAAATIDGPLLIIAGPGSGKTRTLTHRIAHMVADRGIAAASCLAITFTRRAAAEMRERLGRLIPHDASAVAIHTFHSFALSILRQHGDVVGLHRGFRIASEAERVALLTETLGATQSKSQRMLRAISKAKRASSEATADIAEALATYQQAMSVRNWIDFDDLIGLAVRALSSDADLAAHYRSRFAAISVDEFQDVDAEQYRLVRLLAPTDSHPNLCVIGDPDQAIYGFRGADASCFARFGQDYPAATVVSLARNYRSSGTIVAAASQVIAAQGAHSLAEIVRDMHERITIHTAPTEAAEAESVVHAIEQMIGGATFFSFDSGRTDGMAERNLSFADFAVLYRTDAQSAALAEALERFGMPIKRSSHGALAGEPAVAALLAGIEAESDQPLAARLRAGAEVLTAQGAIPAAAIAGALQRLTALAEACGGDRAQLMDAVALASEVDFYDPRADRVSLLTLHAAKGLEFPVVFIVGLEDGILPLHWNEPDEAAMAEERRLFYVGMTRAKDRLILSRAQKRQWRGRLRQLEPSPFLRDIEDELIKHQRSQMPRGKPEDRQLSLF